MGMYEKFAAVIHRDGLTAAQVAILEELEALSDSGVRQHLVISSGSIVNRTDITVSATAPSSPSTNELWIDIS